MIPQVPTMGYDNQWGTPEIVKAYVDQSAVEEEFKNMKNPCIWLFSPSFIGLIRKSKFIT